MHIGKPYYDIINTKKYLFTTINLTMNMFLLHSVAFNKKSILNI